MDPSNEVRVLSFSEPEVEASPTAASTISKVLAVVGFDHATAAHLIVGLLTWFLFCFLLNNWFVTCFLLGSLIPTQVTLATAWAVWSAERRLVRVGCWLWRLGIIYFLLLVVFLIFPQRPAGLLWHFPLLIASVAFAGWLPAAILSLLGWRHSRNLDRGATLNRVSQFQISDALRWTTYVCVLLAAMAWFPISNFDGRFGGGYFIFPVYFTIAASPLTLLVVLAFWVCLGDEWTRIHSAAATLLLLVAGYLVLVLVAPPSRFPFYPFPGHTFWIVGTIGVLSLIITITTGLGLRLAGWRLQRRPTALAATYAAAAARPEIHTEVRMTLEEVKKLVNGESR